MIYININRTEAVYSRNRTNFGDGAKLPRFRSFIYSAFGALTSRGTYWPVVSNLSPWSSAEKTCVMQRRVGKKILSNLAVLPMVKRSKNQRHTSFIRCEWAITVGAVGKGSWVRHKGPFTQRKRQKKEKRKCFSEWSLASWNNIFQLSLHGGRT